MWRHDNHPTSATNAVSALSLHGLMAVGRLEWVCWGEILCILGSPGLKGAPSSSPLAVGAVAHEAVSPHEFFAAAVAVVRLQACVCLHVLRQVVLHLELLGTDRAMEWPQVQVHVDVPVTHALVRKRLPAVAHEHLP